MGKQMALAVLVVVQCLVVIDAAHAYVDPGSGSMLLQLLLGGVAGAVVLVKYYWHRLRALLGFQERE
jgi:hypothetical protein